MRLCSHLWRSTCDRAVRFVSCKAPRLADAVLFLCKLPKLDSLTIQGDEAVSYTLKRHALSTLTASLNMLQFVAGQDHTRVRESLSLLPPRGWVPWGTRLQVRQLPSLLLPFSQHLHSITLINCFLPSGQGSALCKPGFWSAFKHLTSLQLQGVRSIPDLTILDLSGCICLHELDVTRCHLLRLNISECKMLCTLMCFRNKISALDTVGNVQLRTLDCSSNCLSSLNLSSSILLTSLCCGYNSLTTLELSACCNLNKLCCFNNQLGTVMLSQHLTLDDMSTGCNTRMTLPYGHATRLSCDSNNLKWLSRTLLENVQALQIFGRLKGEIEGFKRLHTLHVGGQSTGLVNLKGCTSVRLDMDCMCDGVKYLGRILPTILGVASTWCLADQVGHSTPTVLILVIYTSACNNPPALDLSCCTALTKLSVRSVPCDGSPSRLAEINLAGCSNLTSVTCRSLPSLTYFNAFDCLSLLDVDLSGSGLTRLDVSCCPNIKSLDVSGSQHLCTITLSESGLAKIIFKDCPKLQF